MMELIKKRCFALLVLLTASMSLIDAGQARSGWNDGVSFCDDQDDCCTKPSCCKKSKGQFFVRGDLLYWKPHVSGAELAFGTASIAQNVIGDVQITVMNEYDADPHFKWDAGYRLAAGYQFDCSQFEVDAFWTHFNGDGSRRSCGHFDTSSTGKYRVKLDQFDLLLAYNLDVNPCFSVKPFLGLRGTKICQSIHAHLVTDIALSPTSLAFENRTFDDSQNFRGIGPILGFEANWNMGRGFGFYGTAAGGVLYGVDKVKFADTDIFTAPISQGIFSNNKRHLHEFNANIDLALGLQWQTCISNWFELTMKIGFEHHQYFDLGFLSAQRGDLCFDGAVFSIDIAL